MSEKFKAVVIDNQNEKFTREIKELSQNDLKDGERAPHQSPESLFLDYDCIF